MDVYRSTNGLFLNSKCIFVEYVDIIKSPYFILAWVLSTSKDILKEPFDTGVLNGLDADELAEWYYHRKHQNLLLDLIPNEKYGEVDLDKVDSLLDQQIQDSSALLDSCPLLNFGKALQILCFLNDGLFLPEMQIYYPFKNETIHSDILGVFENIEGVSEKSQINIKYVYGDIGDVLRNVPDDSTYVFSDISNVLVLEELGKLDYASILIPSEYHYNFDDEDEDYLINFDELAKEHPFKFSTFLASIVTEEDE